MRRGHPQVLTTNHMPCLTCRSPPTSFDTVLSIVLMACYGTDILLTFFVAFYEEGQLVCNLKGIASETFLA